eukprot:12306312-Alexandrium_andersonii.AAC.1
MAMISTFEDERHRRLGPLLEGWIQHPLTRWGMRVPDGLTLDAPCLSQLRTKHPAVSRPVILCGFPVDKENRSSAVMSRVGRLVDRSSEHGDGRVLRWK